MIIELENFNGEYIGAIQIWENDCSGEISIKNIDGNISIADIDIDDIFGTNEDKLRIQLEE